MYRIDNVFNCEVKKILIDEISCLEEIINWKKRKGASGELNSGPLAP